MPKYTGINTVDMMEISKMIRDTSMSDGARKGLASALCDYFKTRRPLISTQRFYSIMTRGNES